MTKPVYLLVQVFFEVTPQLNCYTYTLKQFLDFPSYAVVLFVVFVYYVVGYVNDGLMAMDWPKKIIVTKLCDVGKLVLKQLSAPGIAGI